jgi:hypothetical protein
MFVAIYSNYVLLNFIFFINMEMMDNDNDQVNWVGNVLLQFEFNNNETKDLWRPGAQW